MRRRDVAKELNGPVARRLLSGAIPARFAYLALDGTPRAIPIGFLWNGREVVMCTATNSAKVKALKANPQIALTIDTTDHPPQILLIRGAASLETVDGIPDEYLQMQSGLVPADQLDGWLAGVRELYRQMVRITVTPTWAKVIDFEKTLPSAVAELAAKRQR